jgi:GT2 family glycosyltransferase
MVVKKLSVIVVNWNGLRFLGPCIGSLMDQTSPADELILVDNGSRDGSVEYVKRNFPSVRIVESVSNLGFAEGTNVGLRCATGDHFLLINNDTHVPPNFIEILRDVISVGSGMGSVGCRIVQEDGEPRYGPLVSNLGFLVPLFMDKQFFRGRIAALFGTEGFCMANCGAAVLYTRQAIEDAGGFDTDYWSDWEDHDLGFRLWLVGYSNFYTTKTHIVHVGAGSFGRSLSRDRYVRIIRNMLFTYLKNYDSWNLATRFFFLLLVVLPIRHLLMIIVYELRRLLQGPIGEETLASRQIYLALPQAYISFFKGVRGAMRKRARVQAQRKVPDSEIFRITDRGWII